MTIESFHCWRCRKRISPEDLVQDKRSPTFRDLHEADLSCQAELCLDCWREIELSTKDDKKYE